MSQERPSAQETAPEGRRPGSAAPGRWGLREWRPRGVWRRGPGQTPPVPGRQVTPPLLTSRDVQPSPPPAPETPQHRSPPPAARDRDPDPDPTRPRRRPLQAAVEDTGQATSPDGSGDGGSRQRGPGGGRQLGRGLSPGAAGAGPRVGSASAPHEQSGRGALGAGEQRAGATHRRAGGRAQAGLAGSGDRGGPGRAPRARWRREGGGERRVRGRARKHRCGGRACGPGWPLQPRGAGTGQPGRAAALGGRGSDAAAFPFSCPGPCSPASSPSLGPRRRLSLGASPASSLHQGRADPQGPSRKVRGCCRSPQLLVAIFNPPPPPPVSPPPAGCLTD